MKAHLIAGAALLGLGLSTAIASAAPYVGSGATPGYLQQQQQLRNDPGYSVGTGAAHLGDGAEPGYLHTQRQLETSPGYFVGQ